MRYLLLLPLILLAACGSPVVAEQTMPATTITAPPPEPTTRTTYQVGDKATLPDGETVQVHRLAWNVPPYPNVDYQGKRLMAADVEWCVTAGSPVQATAFAFRIVLPDNSRDTDTVTNQRPSFATTVLNSGDCNRGWISFEYLPGQRPKAITMTSQGASISWAVPR